MSTATQTFVSSAIAAETPPAGQDLTYEIDGLEVTFESPDLNQIVLMTSLIEGAQSSVHSAAQIVNIFFALIKDDEIMVTAEGEETDDETIGYSDYTARKLQAKMMDRKDPFGVEVMAAVLEKMIEDWSNRPTRRSTASSSSPRARGTTSKATPRGGASTRGRAR